MGLDKDPVPAALDGLRRIVKALRTSAHSAERGLGVTGAQLFVLRELEAAPGASLTELAHRTMTDPSSVSVVVARLVSGGLVSRARDPDDGRRAVLTLSARGRAALRKGPEPIQRRLIEALQAQPQKRVRRFAEILDDLAAALGADAAPAAMFFEEEPAEDGRPPAKKR